MFDRLAAGDFDCVIAGSTVTPEREERAAFLPPYLISGQGLAVDTTRLPQVRSTEDLAGLTLGAQRGTTSERVAGELVAAGIWGGVRGLAGAYGRQERRQRRRRA